MVTEKGDLNMIYRISRDENEATILQLVEKYPKCFFGEPRQRVPIKKSIRAELQAEGFPADYGLIASAVDWYESHLGYQYVLETGRKRIDLNGKEVGTVTEQEHLAAQKKIKADLQKVNERNSVYSSKPTTPLQPCKLRKTEPAAPVSPAPLQEVSPELMPIYEALQAANNAISATPSSDLRAALASAALGVLVKEAQRAIENFNSHAS